MSRISNLLASILSAVYGKDVRQSIHDAIEECYIDVSNSKTLSEEASNNANAAAASAESRTTAAISSMETKTNAAISNCNSATTTANTAASRTTAAISSMETKTNAAISNCNSAADSANTAANNAISSKETCDAAIAEIPEKLEAAIDGFGLVFVDGKLCVKVERNDE